MKPTIRKVTSDSIDIIANLSRRIWPVVYDYMISKEQIEYMLNLMYSQESLLNQFRDGHQFYLAYVNESPVGFASWSAIDQQKAKLHKLYVLAEWHGKKIGFELLNHIEQEVRNKGYKALYLNVNRNNKTIAFYERYGFTKKETVDIDIGNGFYMNDYVMMKELG